MIQPAMVNPYKSASSRMTLFSIIQIPFRFSLNLEIRPAILDTARSTDLVTLSVVSFTFIFRFGMERLISVVY